MKKKVKSRWPLQQISLSNSGWLLSDLIKNIRLQFYYPFGSILLMSDQPMSQPDNPDNLEVLAAPPSRKRLYIVTAIIGVILVSAFLSISYQTKAQPQPKVVANLAQTQQGDAQREPTMKLRSLKLHAPELEGGHGWLNTDKPIKMANLRGKIVLLDFWTYCCINCIHIVPDLKKLEAKYPNELVVIGVHSAKFKNEKESDNIRQAILRYDIVHPVVNDSDFEIWSNYAVHSWPSLYMIDPDGYVVDLFSGEGNYEELDADIAKLITEYKANGKLNQEPLSHFLEKDKVTDGQLSFPGKIVADQEGQRLFISDSNHNRIVITKLTGELIDTIGNGQIGQQDGSYTEANFNHPQGMALASNGETLYVADTENHLIRQIDLKTKKVETIAGTGQQSLERNNFGLAKKVGLNSPWDLQLVDDILFIAMAGPHQIWFMDLKSSKVGPFAGSGREGHVDGPRPRASLAQPSGITFNGKSLFIADSEVSTIRAIDLKDNGEVSSIAGSGDLFGFGDEDGTGEAVRFQHPLGVHFSNGMIYVADTYNHKIKMVDPKDGSSQTFLGAGKPGKDDGKNAKFYEPSGLSVAGDKLYIADTNNHLIRVADLKTKEVTTLKLTGLNPPEKVVSNREVLPNREDIKLPVQHLAANSLRELTINLQLPEGYHLNPASNHSYRVSLKPSSENGSKSNTPPPITKVTQNLQLPLKLPLPVTNDLAKATLEVAITVYYCPVNDAGACKIKSIVWTVPIEWDKNSKLKELSLSHKLE